ncbi:MAG: hypothetical protein V4610_15675 [Pseudomonadota bacterium]|jgi:hypothetical protein
MASNPSSELFLVPTEIENWNMQIFDSNFQITFYATQVSSQAAADNVVYDSFLITQDLNMNFGTPNPGDGHPLSHWAYTIDNTSTDYSGSSSVMLIDSKPDTSQGATGFNSSISHSQGGSIGAFGDQETVGFNNQVTMSDGKSISVKDVTVEKLSQDNINNAKWLYTIMPGTPSSLSELSVQNVWLWQCDRKAIERTLSDFRFTTYLTIAFVGPSSLLYAEQILLKYAGTSFAGSSKDPTLPWAAVSLPGIPLSIAYPPAPGHR